MVNIEQLLPQDNYDALVASVSSPSGSNAYATIADLSGFVTNNIYTADDTLTGDRVVDGGGIRSLTFDDIAGFGVVVTATTSGTTSWASGTDSAVIGAGLSPTGFEAAGGAGSYFATAGTKAYSASYKFGTDAYIQHTLYDAAFSIDEAGVLIQPATGGGNNTAAQLYHWEYGSGNYYGFEANVFGERILSQSAGLNRLSALDTSAGMTFLSGSGGTGYIGVVDQAGFINWMGASWPTGDNLYNIDGALTGNRTVTGAFDINWNNTGDFRRTGDILFAAGADRLFAVEDRTGVGNGYDLTVEAGGGGTAGPNTGGDLILTPGAGGQSGPLQGAQGDIYLLGKNGTTIAKGTNIYITGGGSAGNAGGDINLTTGTNTGVGGQGGNMIVNLGSGTVSEGTFEITGTFGTAFLVDGGTGKVTIPGLLDPIGLKMTPTGANPGVSETLWSNSGDTNRPYWDGNRLAYFSELIADTTIYDTDGVVGSGRTATVTDTITWDGGTTIFKGAGTDETSNIIELQDSGSVQRLRFTDDARMKVQFNGPIDAGVAARNHVIQWDADVTERTGGDGYSVYQFTSSFAGANVSNHFRTLHASAPIGGVDPAFGRYAVYGDGYGVNRGVGIYGRSGNGGGDRSYGVWASLAGGLATSQNYGVYSLLQNNAAGSLTAENKAFYGLNSSGQATVTGTMFGGHFWSTRSGGGIGIGTNIGIRAAATGAGTNIAMQVLANQGVIVFGTTNPVTNTMYTQRSVGADDTTWSAQWQKSNGAFNMGLRDDAHLFLGTNSANVAGLPNLAMSMNAITDTGGLAASAAYQVQHNPTVDGNGRVTGLYQRAIKQGSFNSIALTGIVGEGYWASTGDQTHANLSVVGVLGQARAASSGYTIQNMFGGDFNVQAQGVDGAEGTIINMGCILLRQDQVFETTVTNLYHIFAGNPANLTGGVVTNTYVFRSEAPTIGTTNYGMYIEGAGTSNRFAGDMVVGSLVQSAARSTLEVNGDAEVIGSANGVILESPDGNRWQMKIDNSGSWTFTNLP